MGRGSAAAAAAPPPKLAPPERLSTLCSALEFAIFRDDSPSQIESTFAARVSVEDNVGDSEPCTVETNTDDSITLAVNATLAAPADAVVDGAAPVDARPSPEDVDTPQ
jgi:hypothetical protein